MDTLRSKLDRFSEDQSSIKEHQRQIETTVAVLRKESKTSCAEFFKQRDKSLNNVQELRCIINDLADVSRYQDGKISKLERDMESAAIHESCLLKRGAIGTSVNCPTKQLDGLCPTKQLDGLMKQLDCVVECRFR